MGGRQTEYSPTEGSPVGERRRVFILRPPRKDGSRSGRPVVSQLFQMNESRKGVSIRRRGGGLWRSMVTSTVLARGD